MTERPRLAHQPALDGLRGAAVAGVVAFHLGYLDGGFLGVDLFFTLSGYLITRLLLVERDGTGTTDLAGFWKRRAWRLLPALFLVLTAVALYAWLEARPDELRGIREGGLASLLYVTNWFFLSTGDGYWNLFTAPTPFDHLWSLAIEEQFYVVWPLVFVPLAGRGDGRALGWFTGIAAVVTGIWMATGDPADVYLNTITRSSSILLGALLGIALHRGWSTLDRYLTGPVGGVASAASLAFLAWSWIVIDGSDDAGFFQGGFFIHAVAVCVVIGRVTLTPAGPEAHAFSLSPLRTLGIVSYGLYLWHWPVIVIANLERTGTDGTTLLVIRLVVMTVLTAASYVFVERPARHDWSRIPRATWALPIAAVLTAGVLLLGTRQPDAEAVVGAIPTTTSHAPTTTTSPPDVEDEGGEFGQADTAASTTTTSTTTTTVPPLVVASEPLPRLATPTTDDPLRVLLVGDSYLFDAEPGILAAFESVPEVEISSIPELGFAVMGDDALDALAAIRADHEPDLVITMWARFDEQWLRRAGGGPEAEAELEQRMVDAIDVLSTNGATVAVVGLAPSLVSGIDRVPVDLTINEIFERATARSDDAFSIDPDPVVAPDGEPQRWITIDGDDLLVRKVDVSHYCGDGAARWALAIGDLVSHLTDVHPADPADWWAGDWRGDERYDDPEGACLP
ncbi:MAG: acyltransferase family protein [Actinomycetota bacterium]